MSEEKISKKEFVAALEDLNAWLVENDKDVVVTEGLSQKEQLHLFVMPIIEALEAGKASELPDSVIEFYNNHLAEEEDEEEEETDTVEPTKTKSTEKTPKKKREKKVKDPDAKKPWEKATGKEKLVYDMVASGKSDAEIEKAIRDGYKDTDDKDFVDWRVFTYMTKGKNFYAKDNPEFAEKWAEAKKKIAPVPHPKKKLTPEENAAKDALIAQKKAEAEEKKAKVKEKKVEEKKVKAEAAKAEKPKAEKPKAETPVTKKKSTEKGK